METIDITFDLERSKRLCKKYIQYEQKKAFAKIPTLPIFLICFVLITIGFYLSSDLLYFLGLTTFISFLLFHFYYSWHYKRMVNAYLKALEDRDIASERAMKFGFDDNEIMVKSANTSSKISWKLISHYEIDGEEIYLFLQKRQLHDIISKSIIGDECYDKFLKILKKKVREMPSKN